MKFSLVITTFAAVFATVLAVGLSAATVARANPPSAEQDTGDSRPRLKSDSSVPVSQQRQLAHQTAATVLEAASLFDDGVGMFATPAVSEFYFNYYRDQSWKGSLVRHLGRDTIGLYSGLIKPTGFHEKSYEGVPIVITGCATCHFGRALGRTIPGLGNKNVDPMALGKWIESADAVLSRLPSRPPTDAQRLLQERSLAMALMLQNKQTCNQTQGMVPVANIARWFYEQAGRRLPADTTPAAVKVPALWGYGEKVKSGQFCDGMGDGREAGWAAAVELAAGNTAHNVLRNYHRVETIEKMLEELLPPAYPLSIDRQQAAAGQQIYSQHCQSCHGSYERDAAGLPVFQSPPHIPLEDIGTDADRVELVTSDFLELINRSPMGDKIRARAGYTKGYFAPRLESIWARFPYLHNGSVPSLAALLTPTHERPNYFSLTDVGELDRFDEATVGLTVPPPQSADARSLSEQASSGARNVYDTSRVGHSNKGHAFGVELSSNDKSALLEYLKTL
jgi:hypothetical protein